MTADALAQFPLTGNHAVFLEGPAGAGKTTAGVARLRHLVEANIPTTAILVLLPQRTLAKPYHDLLGDPSLGPAGEVDILTLDGLALRLIDLFWPLIAGQAGFGKPQEPPVFLTLETAQYYMRRAVEPLLERGYFDPNVVPVTIRPARLMSQILDNLNKAALIGIPHTEVAERLKGAMAVEDAGQRVAYEHAQACAGAFREYCLAHNLLDFSLRIETFRHHVWPQLLCQQHLFTRYRHLIVDNVEEDTPLAHEVVRAWLRQCDSALVICDWDAGYRIFLGADPGGGKRLAEVCKEKVRWAGSRVASEDMLRLGQELGRSLGGSSEMTEGDMWEALAFKEEPDRFYPQMLDWAAKEVKRLVDEGTSPGEIAILAPFVGDALRFSLLTRLEALGIPARSHRPSRALDDEPAARCLLTLAKLSHPSWQDLPDRFDVTLALGQAIDGLDLVRAHILSQIVFQPRRDGLPLGPFEGIRSEAQQRITFGAGSRFDLLRAWLEAYAAGAPQPLDHFLSRLFGEVLSQPGFRYHRDLEAGRVVANLVESMRKFRRAAGPSEEGMVDLNREYVRMVEAGVLAALYLGSWQVGQDEAVLVAPAYTFLMANRPVDYQLWLDVGSEGWWERIYQPLTHPYVLSADWPEGQLWTDEDEVGSRRERLLRLILGLVRRCRKRVYLGYCQYGEQGYEGRGPLLMALQAALMRRRREAGGV